MPIGSSFNVASFTHSVNNILNTRRKENLLMATVKWHASIVEILSGQRSGRAYFVPGTGSIRPVPVQVTIRKGRFAGNTYNAVRYKRVGAVIYKASSPGEAPAVRLGDLRQSYRFRVVGPNYMERGEVGNPLLYSIYLEKGTSRMAPRPHVIPAFNAKRSEILAALSRRLDE